MTTRRLWSLAALGLTALLWVAWTVGGGRGSAPVGGGGDAAAPPMEATELRAAPLDDPRRGVPRPDAAPPGGAPGSTPDPTASTPSPDRIRVTLAWSPSGAGVVPVPELVRLDRFGNPHPASGHEAETVPPHPARGVGPDAGAGVLTVEWRILTAGTYRPSWYAWVRVPDTAVRRVVRGSGRAIHVGIEPRGTVHEVRLDVPAAALRPDPELDRVPADPHWRVTARDG